MDKYYKYRAEGPDVQSGLDAKVKIADWEGSDEELEDFLSTIGYDWCAENYDMYKSIEEEEEESGVEWEANFYFIPIFKEMYDNELEGMIIYEV